MAADKKPSSNIKMCPACNTLFENSTYVVCPHDRTFLINPSGVDEVLGMILNDRYEVLEQLHRGGTATIYRAVHRAMDREVCIKVLNTDRLYDQITIKRFQQEAQASSHVCHPGAVTVYDYGFIDSGQPYLVMDYIRGETLQAVVVQEGPLEPKRFRSIFWQLCGTLAHMHDKGIVHRNIKPSNIIISSLPWEAEIPVIIDFNIVKLMPSSRSDQSLTQTGEVFGTPLYMSPEQCMAQSVDKRADIYALGCTMFFALTGETPFKGMSSLDTYQMHMATKAPEGVLPFEFESIVLKALEKKPQDRFQSMDELGQAIGHKPVDKRMSTDRGRIAEQERKLAGHQDLDGSDKSQGKPEKKKKFWFF